MTLTEYLNNNKNILVKKLSENTYKIKSMNKNSKLIGTCTNESVDLSLVSNTGKVLYSVKEDFSNLDNSEDYVVDKIADSYKVLEDTAEIDITDDLNRDKKDSEKELLLDSDDIESSEAIKSLSELRNELDSISIRSQDLINNYADKSNTTKSLILGTMQNLYNAIFEIDNLIENCSDINESVVVAPKADFIDIACKGLSQAYSALKGSNYESLIGPIKDLYSELKISK